MFTGTICSMQSPLHQPPDSSLLMRAKKRLRSDYEKYLKSPPNTIVSKLREDMLEWHFLFIGLEGSPFEGGEYHGVFAFPDNFPFSPPCIRFITPNGRFKVNERLSFEFSDLHPELWKPGNTVPGMLEGVYCFMMDQTTDTVGSLNRDENDIRSLASKSKYFNGNNRLFSEVFGNQFVFPTNSTDPCSQSEVTNSFGIVKKEKKTPGEKQKQQAKSSVPDSDEKRENVCGNESVEMNEKGVANGDSDQGRKRKKGQCNQSETCQGNKQKGKNREETRTFESKEPQTKSMRVIGLNNLGNNGYFNSALQNLIYLRPFRDQLARTMTRTEYTLVPKKHPDLPVITFTYANNQAAEPGKLTKELHNLIKQTLQCEAIGASRGQKCLSVSPWSVQNEIARKYEKFSDCSQQDSHELLRSLIDMVKDEEIQRLKTAFMDHFKTKGYKTKFNKEERKILEKYAGEFDNTSVFTGTFIDEIFGGKRICRVQCLKCYNTFDLIEDFLDISLPLPAVSEKCKSNTNRKPQNQNNKFPKTKSEAESNWEEIDKIKQFVLQLTPEIIRNMINYWYNNLKTNNDLGTSRASGQGGKNSDEGSDVSINERNCVQTRVTKLEQERNLESEIIHCLNNPEGTKNDAGANNPIAMDTDSSQENILSSERENRNSLEQEEKGVSSPLSQYEPMEVDEAPCNVDSLQQPESETNPKSEEVNNQTNPQPFHESTSNTDDASRSMEKHEIETLETLDTPRQTKSDNHEESGLGICARTEGQRPLDCNSLQQTESKAESNSEENEDKVKSEEVKRLKELPEYPKGSLEYYLMRFFSPETLKNDYVCTKCNPQLASEDKPDTEDNEDSKSIDFDTLQFSDAVKQFHMKTLPPVLAIHLKRFSQSGFRLQKVNAHVEFPLVLDMAPFCTANTPVPRDHADRILYGLRGIVSHSGGMVAGHYVAYVNIADWPSEMSPIIPLHISDSHYYKTDHANVFSTQAYILFYERLPLV